MFSPDDPRIVVSPATRKQAATTGGAGGDPEECNALIWTRYLQAHSYQVFSLQENPFSFSDESPFNIQKDVLGDFDDLLPQEKLLPAVSEHVSLFFLLVDECFLLFVFFFHRRTDARANER